MWFEYLTSVLLKKVSKCIYEHYLIWLPQELCELEQADFTSLSKIGRDRF